MSEKLKGLIGFLLVFVIFFVGAELMAEDYGGGPVIKDFEMVQAGGSVKFSFRFFNTVGGLEAAEISIVAVVMRNDEAVFAAYQTGEFDMKSKYVSAYVAGDDGRGYFEAIVPSLKEKYLKSGDKIRYSIFLTDKNNRKSNTVLYEFVFVEKRDI